MMKRLIFLMMLALPVLVSAQERLPKPQRENGVIVKAGITQTIFNKAYSTSFSNARTGYLLGFDGLFHDGLLIFQPGIYGVFHNAGTVSYTHLTLPTKRIV